MLCPECKEKELVPSFLFKDVSEKTQQIDIHFACYHGCGHRFHVNRHICITEEELLDGINQNYEQEECG